MTSRIDYNDPKVDGTFGLPYHYEMVSDTKRVGAFRAAIRATCRDRTVLESGAGSGILSILTARAGARKVYAVEVDPVVAAIAARNIERSGASTVELLQKNIFAVTVADLGGHAPDVVIAENLSTWQVTEPELEIMNHINRELAEPDAIRIPARIRNMVELANAQYVFEDCVEVRTCFFQFSGIVAPQVMSERTLFQEVHLGDVNPTLVDRSADIRATRSGVVNCLLLTSPLVLHEEVIFESSDSLVPPVVVPLETDVLVSAGDTVRIHICYKTNSTWSEFLCSGHVRGSGSPAR